MGDVEIRVYEDNAGGLHLVALASDGGPASTLAVQHHSDAEAVRAAISDPSGWQHWDPQPDDLVTAGDELIECSQVVWQDGLVLRDWWGGAAREALHSLELAYEQGWSDAETGLREADEEGREGSRAYADACAAEPLGASEGLVNAIGYKACAERWEIKHEGDADDCEHLTQALQQYSRGYAERMLCEIATPHVPTQSESQRKNAMLDTRLSAQPPTVIARWESKGGAYVVELHKAPGSGWYYRALDAGGYLGNAYASDTDAIAAFGARVNDFQADANKTPMKRII